MEPDTQAEPDGAGPQLALPSMARQRWSPGRLFGGLSGAIGHGTAVGRLADGRPARAKVIATAVGFGVARKLGRPPRKTRRLALAKDGTAFGLVVDDLGDLAAIHGVLLEEEYRIDELPTPRTIVDLGSHIGTSIIYFRLRHPDARIVGFEPSARNFAKLAQNVAHLDGVTIHRAAGGGADGRALLNPSPDSLAPSLAADADDLTEEVQLLSLDTIMDREGIDRTDLLKIDIEGAEFELLSNASLDRVGAIVGEFHQSLSRRSIHEFKQLLGAFHVSGHEVNSNSYTFTATRSPPQ